MVRLSRNFVIWLTIFRSYVRSGPVALVRRNISEQEAVALEDVFFRRFPGADARFIYINEDRPHFTTAHGASRSVKGEGSFGDPIAWWAALQDEGLIGPAFRHSTTEILRHDFGDENLATVDRFTEVQLQTAAAVNSDHGKFALELARFYIRKQRWDKAEELARLALARSPGLPNAVFELNYINWKAKKITPDEAASAFILFHDTETHDPAWLTETCAALLEAGRIEEAVVYSGKAVMANPQDSEAHYTRALCLMKRSSFKRAEFAITTAINLRDHAYMHHIHATILGELGRWDDAVTAAKAACKIDGGVFYINHLASLLMRSAEALAPTPAGALIPATVVAAPAAFERSVEQSPAELPLPVPAQEESVAEAEELPESGPEETRRVFRPQPPWTRHSTRSMRLSPLSPFSTSTSVTATASPLPLVSRRWAFLSYSRPAMANKASCPWSIGHARLFRSLIRSKMSRALWANCLVRQRQASLEARAPNLRRAIYGLGEFGGGCDCFKFSFCFLGY